MIDMKVARRYGRLADLDEACSQFDNLRTRFAFLLKDPLLAERTEVLATCMSEAGLDQDHKRSLGYACYTLGKFAEIIIWQLYLAVETMQASDRLLCLTERSQKDFADVNAEIREYLDEAISPDGAFGVSARVGLACAERAMHIASICHKAVMTYAADPRHMPFHTRFDRMMMEVRAVPNVPTPLVVVEEHHDIPEPPEIDEISKLFAGAEYLEGAYVKA